MKIDPRQPSRCPECDAEFEDPGRIERHFFETHLVPATDVMTDQEGGPGDPASGA